MLHLFTDPQIRDYHRLIDQLARVVLPGGLIDLTEYDFQAYNHFGKVIKVDLSVYKAPWWARWLCHLRDAVNERGGDIHASAQMYSWVKANPAYENVVYLEHYLGVVPHPRTGPNAEALRQIDKIMADNVLVNSELLFALFVTDVHKVVRWCWSATFAGIWFSRSLFV